MTKKSDKAAGDFFKGFAKGFGDTTTGAVNGGMNFLSQPFKSFDNLADGLTGGPGLYILLGGGVLLMVMMNRGSSVSYMPAPVQT